MWKPQPGAQLIALEADWCNELFFGGERGGGKSDFQLGYQEDGATRYESAWRGIMFRKTYPELEELQSRACEIFPKSGAKFKTQPSAEFPFSNCWYWPNGASVKMRYIEAERDYERYHGHQYTGVSFDEVTQYATATPVLKMISTMRSATGVPCTMRLTGNPGGIGHSWVKDRYIDMGPPLTPYDDPETGFTRMFVPSKLTDNKILEKNDPGYRGRLLAATDSNEVLRKAWLEGDWDIVAGSAFNISREKHLLRPFTPPKHWVKFFAFDWGYVKPYAGGWFCVPDEDFILTEKEGFPERWVPKDSVILYREIYGTTGKPNEGSREDSEQVVKNIMDMEKAAGEKMDYRVADTAIWAKTDGPSTYERMLKESQYLIRERGYENVSEFMPRQSIKDRQANYNELCVRLKGDEIADGEFVPMFYATANCSHWWRTVPSLVLDEVQPEKGPDGKQEDHAYDMWSYGMMSRPYSLTKGQRINSHFHKLRKKHNVDRKADPYRMRSK